MNPPNRYCVIRTKPDGPEYETYVLEEGLTPAEREAIAHRRYSLTARRKFAARLGWLRRREDGPGRQLLDEAIRAQLALIDKQQLGDRGRIHLVPQSEPAALGNLRRSDVHLPDASLCWQDDGGPAA